MKNAIITSLVTLASCSLSFSQQYRSIIQEETEKYSKYSFKSEHQWDSIRAVLEGIPVSSLKTTQTSTLNPSCTLNKRVFGWFPYWQGTTYTNFQWNLLSDFCYFDYSISASTGTNTNSSYQWLTSNAVTTAKANGCKIHICAALFSGHSTFFASSTAKNTFINNIISDLNARGGNGVNIDFEGMTASDKTNFTNFIIQLKTALQAANPNYEVSIALYAVDWSNVFDIPALVPYVDAFIIMGYDYYWSGSSHAGPTDPFYNFQTSYNYTLSKSVTYYLKQGVPLNKLLLGLPYYGREWETTSNSIPSNTTGNFSTTRTYLYVKNNSTGYYTSSNKIWDQNSFTPVYVFQVSGAWRQCWIDDAYSMSRRFDFVNQRGIGGIGIWALGYDDGYTDFWQAIQDKFTSNCRVWPCTDSLFDMGGPNRNYYDSENYTYTIYAPSPTQKLNVQFAPTFTLENNYDSLWLYNGNSTASPLIGVYTGGNNPGTFITSTNALTVKFKSDGATNAAGFKAIYQCTTTATGNPTTSIASVPGWITATYTANILDNPPSGASIQKGYYSVACFNGTEWTANNNRGFFYDDFNSLSSLWTIKTGTWNVTGSTLVQTDETSSAAGNTNIYAALTQTLSNRYLYHFKFKLEGTGTNRRGGFHFFCDNADSSNRNNSYFVWFRLDNQKFQLYKVVNNSFGSPVVDIPHTFSAAQWYDVKVIHDRITGEIWTYWNNQLINYWQDPSPFAGNNGQFISFRSGNSKMSIDSFRVYRSRTNTPVILVGSGNTDLMYQNPIPSQYAGRIFSICQDNYNNLSNIATQTLNVDWTPPTSVAVNDGSGSDINVVCTKDTLKANWSNSNDPNSAVSKYWYSIGTSAGATNIKNWTNNGLSTSITTTISGLVHGQTYYFNVKAENGAGLQSSVSSSNGQTVDTTCVSTIAFVYYDNHSIRVFPNPAFNKIFVENIPANKNYLLEITDVVGKQIFKQSMPFNSSIDISNFENGCYIVRIYDENKNQVYENKIIIQH
ncbi:MAG TPA: glycosyl hydrolase family 18 protein [Bacteroidia bacterium]|nr:glycosyl hydrolase family 18 protein [Bacteroidia bacterium]